MFRPTTHCRNNVMRRSFLRHSLPAWTICSQRAPFYQTFKPRDSDNKKSFKNQLYDASASRIAGQRAEEARIVDSQRKARGSGRSLAGVFVITVISLAFYYLGTLSHPEISTSSTAPLNSITPPQHNLAKANFEAAWTDFVSLVGKENVSTQHSELERHTTSDWSSWPASPSDPLPFLVVYPSTTEQVSEIVKICHRRKLPIIPFSGGTSLEGHFTSTRGGIVVDFNQMNKIIKLHEKDLDVIVQPAVGWENLNEYLKPFGLFFPPDPGPGAMIGGMVGTGCSGTNAARYGTMRDWVLSLTVVLADGTVIKTKQRPRKSSAGYDLTRFFIGSEGTLGLITEATLKLAVKPPSESVAVASFNAISEATDIVEKVVRQGVQVAAVELLDSVQMRCINLAGMTSRTYKEAPTLFFKFSGTKAAVKEQVEMVKNIIKTSTKNSSFEFAKSEEEANELWEARKEALWSVVALRSEPGGYSAPKSLDEKKSEPVAGSVGHVPVAKSKQPLPDLDAQEQKKIWTTDVAVPVSNLSDIVEATKKDLDQWSKDGSGIGAIVGHVGDGNFHCFLLFREKDRKVVEDIVHRMVKRAIEMEGTVTGEHGVGLVKRDYLEEELGLDTVNTMRKLKLALDPLCLLNCDKVVRVEAQRK